MKAAWLVIATLVTARTFAQTTAQTTAQKTAQKTAQTARASAAPLASVASTDARIISLSGGGLQSVSGRTAIASGTTVTATPGRNADISLVSGGSVLLCQTSSLHLAGSSAALLLALDRGAMEIRMPVRNDDLIITPDMRLVAVGPGTLDLHMRVTPNGDTCVENRGRKAPPLNITDSFGESNYLLKPGQHLLFERGSLRSVVDRETTPCGCPPNSPAGLPLPEALLRGGQTGNQAGNQTRVTPEQAAAAHPFPTAISDGLAPPDPGPPIPDSQRHVQVSSAIRFDPAAVPVAALEPVAAPVAVAPAPATPRPRKRGPFRAIGRFFKRIFVR